MSEPLRLDVPMGAQPDEETCGPTCLYAVYRFFGDDIGFEQVSAGVRRLEGGGTLAVFLANHALHRGYRATLYTYNVELFDPSWFARDDVDIAARLQAQLQHKRLPRVREATHGYLEFLRLGGELKLKDLSSRLITATLARGRPIITGLSSTFLYRAMRERAIPPDFPDDDVRGVPAGHFVAVCGYDPHGRIVRIADPYVQNPFVARDQPAMVYEVPMARLIGAVFLGILTHDANLLVIEPGAGRERGT